VIGVYKAPVQSTQAVLCLSCDILIRARERQMCDGTSYDPTTDMVAGVPLKDIHKIEREEKFGAEGL